MEPNFKAPKLSPAERAAGKRHMAWVSEQPCCICGRHPPSIVHHCYHDRATRYAGRRAPDSETIPLCIECHAHPHPLAIHTDKKGWRERNGADWSYVIRGGKDND